MTQSSQKLTPKNNQCEEIQEAERQDNYIQNVIKTQNAINFSKEISQLTN